MLRMADGWSSRDILACLFCSSGLISEAVRDLRSGGVSAVLREADEQPAVIPPGCVRLVEVLAWEAGVRISGNASFHKSRAVREYLETWGQRIGLPFLPRYAPETDPIERIWGRLHETITRNHRCQSLVERVEQVYDWFQRQRTFCTTTLTHPCRLTALRRCGSLNSGQNLGQESTCNQKLRKKPTSCGIQDISPSTSSLHQGGLSPVDRWPCARRAMPSDPKSQFYVSNQPDSKEQTTHDVSRRPAVFRKLLNNLRSRRTYVDRNPMHVHQDLRVCR